MPHIAILIMISRIFRSRIYLVLLVGSFIGFLCELAGTHHHRYEYGLHYTAKIFEVPLEVIVMWSVLATLCLAVSSSLLGKAPKILHILYASALMVAYDLALDPAMVRLGMYVWYVEAPRIYGIPITNYIGVHHIVYYLHHLLQAPPRRYETEATATTPSIPLRSCELLCDKPGADTASVTYPDSTASNTANTDKQL